VIFTFGLLLLSERTLPKYLLVIPLLWSLLGASAAFSLGIREDIGLLATGLVGSAALFARRPAEKDAAATSSRRPARPMPTSGVR